MFKYEERSISEDYFGVKLENKNISYSLLDKLNYNIVIDKNKAIRMALSYFGEICDSDKSIYISRNSLKIKDSVNFIRRNIIKRKYPNADENLNGWLVLFDKYNEANWGHDCAYLFIIAEDFYYEMDDTMPPSKKIPMDKIK